nr:uncharacterized protein LOC116278866 [Vicugna pacos]
MGSYGPQMPRGCDRNQNTAAPGSRIVQMARQHIIHFQRPKLLGGLVPEDHQQTSPSPPLSAAGARSPAACGRDAQAPVGGAPRPCLRFSPALWAQLGNPARLPRGGAGAGRGGRGREGAARSPQGVRGAWLCGQEPGGEAGAEGSGGDQQQGACRTRGPLRGCGPRCGADPVRDAGRSRARYVPVRSAGRTRRGSRARRGARGCGARAGAGKRQGGAARLLATRGEKGRARCLLPPAPAHLLQAEQLRGRRCSLIMDVPGPLAPFF